MIKIHKQKIKTIITIGLVMGLVGCDSNVGNQYSGNANKEQKSSRKIAVLPNLSQIKKVPKIKIDAATKVFRPPTVKKEPTVFISKPRTLKRVLGHEKIGRPYREIDVAINKSVLYRPRKQPNYDEVGYASWYGAVDGFHGKDTANGELFDQYAISAAHKTLPLPSYVRVTHMGNKKSIIVRVNDRGPFHRGRIIDLSRGVAEVLGVVKTGVAKVRVQYVGRAPLQHREIDDQYLLKSYTENGKPVKLAYANPNRKPVPLQRPQVQQVALTQERKEETKIINLTLATVIPFENPITQIAKLGSNLKSAVENTMENVVQGVVQDIVHDNIDPFIQELENFKQEKNIANIANANIANAKTTLSLRVKQLFPGIEQN